MQRKGCVLRKRGFGLITAIVLLVLISTVAMMILSISATSSKKATDDYLRIQAEMLTRSATEFAVMRVQGFDRSGGHCLENLDINAAPFDVNVTINYLFSKSTADALTGCNNKYATDVSDADLNGIVIMDVVVTQQMPTTDSFEWSSEPIRIHKRTIQKP